MCINFKFVKKLNLCYNNRILLVKGIYFKKTFYITIYPFKQSKKGMNFL